MPTFLREMGSTIKQATLVLLLLAALVLVGCQSTQPEATTTPEPEESAPTAEPTSEPTAEPTEEQAELNADAEAVMTAALTARPWQWVAFTNPTEQFEVEMPENHLLTFFDDGTFSLEADCNIVMGVYTDDAGSLSLELGPATLATCPGESRGEQMVELLGGAADYFFEDGNLFIDLMADGGTMALAPVPFPELTGTPWQWISFSGNSGQYDVEMPQSYLLTFNDDGTVAVAVDCNNAFGDYTTDEVKRLDISMGPATLALCPGDSRSEQFIEILEGAERYFIEGQNLFIVVEEDGGTMVFALADAASTGTGAIDNVLTVNPWQWVAFTNPADQFEVTAPESYVLTFYDDGSMLIEADCDTVFANFTGSADNSLAITVGPTTLAACPGDSRAEQFVELLGRAARYFFEEDNLFIDLMADGGTLELAPVAVPPDALTTNPWQWHAFTGPTEQFEVTDPENYGLSFYKDSTLLATADCNFVFGDFSAGEDGSLSIALGPTTLAVCPGESRSEQLLELLDGAVRYFIEDGTLYIDLMADGGTLAFTPVPAPEAEAAGAVVANGDQITIDVLLTHTGGIYDYFDGVAEDDSLYAGATDKDVLTAAYTPEELVQLAVESGESGAEGQWIYSDTGYSLLGMIIEATTRQTYEENSRVSTTPSITGTVWSTSSGYWATAPDPGLLKRRGLPPR